MRPIFPGQFPSIKRNLFNIVLILDLLKPTSLHILGGTVSDIIDRGIPSHFGLVPSTTSDESRKMAKAVYWLFNNGPETHDGLDQEGQRLGRRKVHEHRCPAGLERGCAGV